MRGHSMKLTVFGATGGTGRHLLEQALATGHEVTAVVRDPAKLPGGLRERIAVVPVSMTDAGEVEAAVQGRDAVITAIGPRDMRAPADVCAATTPAIIAAMLACGGGRLVTASNSALAAGPGDDPLTRDVVKPVTLPRLPQPAPDDL